MTPLGKSPDCAKHTESDSQLEALAPTQQQVVSVATDVDHGVRGAVRQRGQYLACLRARVRNPLSFGHVFQRKFQDSSLQLLPVTASTLERIPSSMARNRKRSRRSESASQETEFYVTVAHEPGATCDSCAQPRPVLIETEDGQWWCEVCTGQVDGDELWRAAVIALMGNDGI